MAHDDPAAPSPPSPPLPARDGAAPPPTPVRASFGDGAAAGPPAERTGVAIEVDGVAWTARVGGMSRSGAASASAPILLLVFEPAGGVDEAPREAWVVGRSLSDLTDLQIEGALRRSEPAPATWAAKPLFPECGSRSGKDG